MEREVRRHLAVVIVNLPETTAGQLAAYDSLRLIEVSDAEDAAAAIAKDGAEIVLVSVRDGVASARVACRAVRGDPRTASVPLVVWGRHGARDEELDAFAAGADDYISGSPPTGTLVARLHAIARRSRGASPDVSEPADQALRVGSLTVEPDSYRLRIDGQSVTLTAGEFRLLWTLAVHGGTVVTFDQLARSNQRTHDVLSDKSIRAFISSLRRKMGRAAPLLRTVRGVGYRLAED